VEGWLLAFLLVSEKKKKREKPRTYAAGYTTFAMEEDGPCYRRQAQTQASIYSGVTGKGQQYMLQIYATGYPWTLVV